MLNTYVIKYGGTGISLLLNQLTNNPPPTFDYLDPITTVIKIGLIGYKNIGTKIGIHDHMLCVQEPSIFQCIQRYLNQDDRNQLYQLRYPLFYFHGISLGYINHDIYQPYQTLFDSLKQCTIQGLKRLKTTYHTTTLGSITTNCLDNYIDILSGPISEEEFNQHLPNIINPMVRTIYQAYLTKWTDDDFKIIERLINSLTKQSDKITQNALCQTIDAYLNVKNSEISTIRPV